MEINIEEYSGIYYQQVVDVILPIQQEEFNIPIQLDDQPDLKDIPGFYQKDNGNFWVAVINEVVVGTISLLDIGNGQGALRKMFVKAGYRGKEFGVGQALLNALLAWAKQNGFKEI